MSRRGAEVEVADFIDGKLGIFETEDSVDDDFDDFERASFVPISPG